MLESILGAGISGVVAPIVGAALVAFLLIVGFVITKCGAYWLQAYMSGADVSLRSLVAMYFLKLDMQLLVTAKIMARQAGLPIDRSTGMTTTSLTSHALAGGDVMNVIQAIIVARQAGIDLTFDRAAAIDLAGRDVLDAVQTSVLPKVIHCPDDSQGRRSLSAVAKNGVELRVAARVTVRTNLDQLIGGATEETVIARVGQAIVSAIGSASTHMDVLEMPAQISAGAMERGLDSNTAFAIVSIDIADIDVGENIGARLQRDQADADGRIARAKAEVRRAEAIAHRQKMKARVTGCEAALVTANAQVPIALADAFRAGNLGSRRSRQPRGVRRNAIPGSVAAPDRKSSPTRASESQGASSDFPVSEDPV